MERAQAEQDSGEVAAASAAEPGGGGGHGGDPLDEVHAPAGRLDPGDDRVGNRRVRPGALKGGLGGIREAPALSEAVARPGETEADPEEMREMGGECGGLVRR